MLLKLGSRGEDVKTLQMTLILRGYDIGKGGPDGVFGKDTEKAVKEFQRDHNLEVDGIVGPATQEALHHDYSGNTDYGELLKVGSGGPQVAEMQRLLIKAGFSVGAAGADGIFGSGTENAVKRFQESRGLAADGIIGPETKNALKSNSGSSSKLLKVGARGPEVKELQRLLINTGYSVGSYGADGVFGVGTESAVRRFQSAKGLESDGIVGPATWSALKGGTSSELLRLGSRGESVREAQNLLIKAGYSVGSYGADGVFGAGTESAVKRFQAAKGLSVDGIIGPATWSALRGGSVESGLLKLGSRGDAVRQLQELLIKAGYSVGSYGADGVFGAGTESAVKKFQAAKGLAVDGIVGPATWGALYGSGGNTAHVSGGPGVLKFVRVAEAQEFHERIINSKGEGDNMTPYGAWYGMNGVSWCAIFVSWCANQAGILGSVVPRYHYCADAVNWYRSMGRYRTRQSGYTPKAGDVIFFYDASESAPFCHTGIVTGYENGEVITTEGNKGQAVRHNLRYSRNYWKIHGYGDNGGIKKEEKTERIVVSGSEYDGTVEIMDIGILGKRYKYNFIEPAINELSSLKRTNSSDKITWFISSVDYSKKDKENFKDTARKLNVNIEFFNNKNEFKKYINSRDNLKIGSITVFAHGVPGSIEFGYNQLYPQKYNITIGDLEDIKKQSFSNECLTKLYSCNAATKVEKSFNYLELNRFAGKSFAECWYKSGFGKVQGYNGKTDYAVIFGKDVKAHALKQSKSKGYCESGAEEYPKPTKPGINLITYP